MNDGRVSTEDAGRRMIAFLRNLGIKMREQREKEQQVTEIDDISQTLTDLTTMEVAEQKLRDIHDRVSGKGMYLREGGSPLDVDFLMVRGDLHQKLGQLLYERGLVTNLGDLRIDGVQALQGIEDEKAQESILSRHDPIADLVQRFNRQQRSLHEYMTREETARADVERRRTGPADA